MKAKKIFLVAILGSLLVGCASNPSLDPNGSISNGSIPDDEALWAAYRASVRDASTAEPHEVHRQLTAIHAHSPGLVWRGEPGKSELLVVTWTSWNGFDDSVGQSTTLGRETWVTVAHQTRDFCRDHEPRTLDAVQLRLEQLIGLPPEGTRNRFVQLWIDTDDLFRPCPDPEINDQACGVDYPQSAFSTTDPEYRAWFDQLTADMYGDDGYPWTRLGYTYDWSKPDGVGLSEFIVRQGATVEVAAVTGNAEYCGLE